MKKQEREIKIAALQNLENYKSMLQQILSPMLTESISGNAGINKMAVNIFYENDSGKIKYFGNPSQREYESLNGFNEAAFVFKVNPEQLRTTLEYLVFKEGKPSSKALKTLKLTKDLIREYLKTHKD